MLDRVIRFFITLTFAIAGGALFRLASPLVTNFITAEFFQVDTGIFKLSLIHLVCIVTGAISGALGGWLVSPFLIGRLEKFAGFVENRLSKMPMNDVIAGIVGLATGLIIANLLGSAFSGIPVVGSYIPIVFSIVLGYIGIR